MKDERRVVKRVLEEGTVGSMVIFLPNGIKELLKRVTELISLGRDIKRATSSTFNIFRI